MTRHYIKEGFIKKGGVNEAPTGKRPPPPRAYGANSTHRVINVLTKLLNGESVRLFGYTTRLTDSGDLVGLFPKYATDGTHKFIWLHLDVTLAMFINETNSVGECNG